MAEKEEQISQVTLQDRMLNHKKVSANHTPTGQLDQQHPLQSKLPIPEKQVTTQRKHICAEIEEPLRRDHRGKNSDVFFLRQSYNIKVLTTDRISH